MDEQRAEEKAKEWASNFAALAKKKGHGDHIMFTEETLAHLIKRCFIYKFENYG